MITLATFNRFTTQEDYVFQVIDLVKPFINDLYDIEGEVFRVQDGEDVTKREASNTVRGLLTRSCKAISTLFTELPDAYDHDELQSVVRDIVMPMLHDQLEIRLKLLELFWGRIKASNDITSFPIFKGMAGKVVSLISVIQAFGSDFGEDVQETAHSVTPESELSAAS